jgi:hypothetical protein
MDRARRHQRALARAAFALLALAAEIVGRSLTWRLDIGQHVAPPRYAGADYYPFLVGAVKIGIALMLARVAWRFAKAHAAERAARRLLGGRPAVPAPRVRLELSPRLWALSFATTSLFYLVETDYERISSGHWPLLTPWVHTSALSVFAVLSVAVAVLYRAAARWLADYESYAEAAVAHARRLITGVAPPVAHPAPLESIAPRFLFGFAFESRPPPLPA